MRIRFTLVVGAALVALTACGTAAPTAGPRDAVQSGSAGIEADASAPPPVAIATPTPGAISLRTVRAKVAGADATVVTFNNRTVYRFEADDHNPSRVNCDSDCLAIWPPLLTDGTTVALSGIDRALVGTVTRADGLAQVTLAGWPLYLFVDDTQSGDTKGEGVGGNWSVIAPDGKPVIKK